VHQQFGRLGALEHLARHDAGLARDVGDVGAVALESVGLRDLGVGVNRRRAGTRRQCNELTAMVEKQCVVTDQQNSKGLRFDARRSPCFKSKQ
jgi:hypothetical protein